MAEEVRKPEEKTHRGWQGRFELTSRGAKGGRPDRGQGGRYGFAGLQGETETWGSGLGRQDRDRRTDSGGRQELTLVWPGGPN